MADRDSNHFSPADLVEKEFHNIDSPNSDNRASASPSYPPGILFKYPGEDTVKQGHWATPSRQLRDTTHYPSVALEGSMNLAVKPPDADVSLRVCGTSVIRIKKRYDYGIYDFEVVRNALAWPAHNDIVWHENF